MTALTSTTTPFSRALRRLYLIRFAFAIVWGALMFVVPATSGAVLTALLVIYPLFDAGAVAWQIRAQRDTASSTASSWVNVAVSIAVAIALGVSSVLSLSAALAIWGIWAIGSGVPQLITAIRNRRAGGQVAQMLSGGISVFAGAAFLVQGLGGSESISGAGGYAVLGGIFFLISAIRLSLVARKKVA